MLLYVIVLVPDPDTCDPATVVDRVPLVQAMVSVQDPDAVAALGSEIAMPVSANTFAVRTDPVAGPEMIGVEVPLVSVPDTVPVEAGVVAAVTPTATAEVEVPALFVAETSKS